MADKNVLYIGIDKVFYDDLYDYYKNTGFYHGRDKCHVDFIDTGLKHWNKEVFSYFIDKIPHLIFLDFTHALEDKEALDDMMEFFNFLKFHYLYKGSPIIGLFKDKEELNTMRHYFTSGMLYGHIKTATRKSIFIDAFYMAFEPRLHFPQYAIAKNINLKHKIGILSTVTQFTVKNFEIETDIDCDIDRKLEVKTNFFADFTPSEFKILETSPRATFYNFLKGYNLEIPYPGPWEEIEENSLQKETVETWLDMNADSFYKKYGNILIIDSTTNNLKDISDYNKTSNLCLKYVSHIDREFEIIRAVKPTCIAYNTRTEDDSVEGVLPNNLATLSLLINYIRSNHDYSPVLLVFNNPSSSEAMRKVYSYTNIMAIPSVLTIPFFEKLLGIYEKTSSSEIRNTEYNLFKSTEKRRLAEVKLEVKVTSLTEHELTFISNDELPMYSVIRMNVPVKGIYLTIVPPIRDIEQPSKGFHYMAFIHSVNEYELQVIRQFVNHIIFEPLEEFKYKKEMGEEPIVEVPENDQVEKEIIKLEDLEESKSDRFEVNRKKNHTGKSKL